LGVPDLEGVIEQENEGIIRAAIQRLKGGTLDQYLQHKAMTNDQIKTYTK